MLHYIEKKFYQGERSLLSMMTLNPLKSLKTLSTVYSSGSHVESNRSRILERKKEKMKIFNYLWSSPNISMSLLLGSYITGMHFLGGVHVNIFA